MKQLLQVLLLAALLVGGCTSGESYFRQGYDFSEVEKVAVLDVQGNLVLNEASRNQVGDFFVMELLKKGYAPIERSQVQSLLNEQDFQQSDVTTTEEAARAGRILNVPAVILINIPKYKEQISLTAKMVNVEDGSILWMASGSGSTGRTLATLLGAAGGAVAGAGVSSESKETVGAIAGGVAGGALGYMLSPQEAETMRKITEKMCESLPQRMVCPPQDSRK